MGSTTALLFILLAIYITIVHLEVTSYKDI